MTTTLSWTARALAVALGVTMACDSPAEEAEHDGQFDDGVVGVGKADDTNGVEDRSFEAECIVRLANNADFETLDDDAGLWSKAARGIIDTRAGADRKLGTSDDVRYTTLHQLDDVDWVGYFAFRSLSAYAKSEGYCPQLGEQYPLEGEEEAATRIAMRIGTRMMLEFMNGEDPSDRGLHAKGRCLEASFAVDNAELPEELRVGLFADNGEYKATIRFSNGNPAVQADAEGDVRGMAIKLVGVQGERVVADGATTQDFLLNHTPALPTANVIDFADVIDAAEDGNPLFVFFNWDEREFEFEIEWSKIKLLLESVFTEINHPLAATYWSQTPYRLGPETSAVKYQARPCMPLAEIDVDEDDPDYFSAAMLESGEACFTFSVQRQLDPEAFPIEDSAIEWSEGRSPFIPVATLRVAAQDFTDEAWVESCQNLSFNPWHALAAHEPLGNLNRARKRVYGDISKIRHDNNGVPEREPTE
ncbi:MAG: catalase family protein [Nannocystaceae bacterium]|nr:catalase family protein [Nannocystaceae bacterium]